MARNNRPPRSNWVSAKAHVTAESGTADNQYNRLARDSNGRALYLHDAAGTARYIYQDGSIDSDSTVDTRAPLRLGKVFESRLILTVGEFGSSITDELRVAWVDTLLRQEMHIKEKEASLRHLGVVAVLDPTPEKQYNVIQLPETATAERLDKVA